MSDLGKAKPHLSEPALEVLFRQARSHDAFSLNPISDAELHAIYDLAKWGPTTANSQPQRILFLRSEQAKARLYPALSSSNLKKSKNAPVVALFAYDLRFFEHLPRMFHDQRARSWYETTPDHIFPTALRNPTLQAAFFMISHPPTWAAYRPTVGF